MQEKASRCRRLTGEVLLLHAVKIIGVFVSFEMDGLPQRAV